MQKFLFGKKDAFGEKKESELEAEDTVIEMKGTEEIVVKAGKGSNLTVGKATTDKKTDSPTNPAALSNDDKKNDDKKSTEDVILDTWDMATEADLAAMTKTLTRTTVNFQTSESQWTPLMVICGLKGASGVSSAVAKCKSLGADEGAADAEGWTALHWCAFHGSAPAAKALCTSFDVADLVDVKDKEGKTVKALCEAEDNMEVWKVVEENRARKGNGGVKKRNVASE